jgi:hypothetical protein
MSDDIQTLKADIAFMRALTDDGGNALALSGAILVVVGVAFGFVNVQYWLVYAQILELSRAWMPWLWVEGVVVAVVAIPLVSRRFPTTPSAASRGMLAAWSAVGIGITVASVALAMGGARVGIPNFIPAVFPIVLFTLYGAAWWVAFAVKRHTWFALVAGACFAAAIASGWLMGTAQEWLVLALGLFLLVALPGFAIVRKARSE